MAFRLVSAETKDLTPELAQEMHQMLPSPTERELNPKRLKHLREKQESGTLITFDWAMAKLKKEDGEVIDYRMNGQHSSEMLVGLNGRFPVGLKAHFDIYEVDDPESLASLFRQFDDRKSSRTPDDVSGAYQGIWEELREIPRKTAKLGLEGCLWYEREVVGVQYPKGDDQYSFFNRQVYYPFLKWLPEVLDIKTPEMKRAAVIAAMYATFIRNEEAAKTFWASVARGGDEFTESDPATVLDAWLKRNTEDTHESFKPKPAHYYQACIYAWNANQAEQPISKLRTDSKKGFLEASE